MNRDSTEETQVFRPADGTHVNAAEPSVTDAEVHREIEPMESAVTHTLEQVHEGMKVIDAAGDNLGKVDYVKMGDPQAVTVDSAVPGEPGLMGDVAHAFGAVDEPKVGPALQARLLRMGYFKVDGKGLIDTDRYVPSDKIADVTGETVRLSATKDDLLQAS